MWSTIVLLTLLIHSLANHEEYHALSAHPYGPHDPPTAFKNAPFFQGWYMRVTGEEHSSMAVILGKYIPPPGSKPRGASPVMCMVMQQPAYGLEEDPPPPRTVTQYFEDLSIQGGASSSSSSNTSSSTSTSTSGSSGAARCRCPPADSDISHPLAPPHLTAETVQAAASQGGQNSQEDAVCRLSVSPAGFEVNAHIPGTVSVSIRSQDAMQGSSSSSNPGFCILPWFRYSAIAESWAQYLGPLIGVHYGLLSMRTPVRVSGAWAEENTQKKIHSSKGVVNDAETPGQKKTVRLAKDTEMLASSRKATLGLDGPGLLHTEAQWGSGFPNKWIWAEGQQFINHDSSMTDPFCGDDAGGVTFVLAGGDLAHALNPPFPQLHLFLFSYRDSKAGVSVTVDPSNPALVTEDVDACSGTASLTLTSFSHVMKVELQASPDTFFPAPCPTLTGFKLFSVESFAAEARISISSRSWKGASGAPKLLSSTTLKGVAMEFGGQYRCRTVEQ